MIVSQCRVAAFSYASLSYTDQSSNPSTNNHYHQMHLTTNMAEPTHSFQGLNIRFPEDTTTEISALRDALRVFEKQNQNPCVFQALIYFFSSLIQRPGHNINDAAVLTLWRSSRAQLKDQSSFIYHNSETCKNTDAIIKRLDPFATFRQLEALAATHVKGDPKSRPRSSEVDYIIISRGHDWIVRCAYELGVPDTWKTWLQLMYEQQPYKILDISDNVIDEGEEIFLNTLEAAARLDGFDAMVPLIKLWLRQASTIVEVWDVHLTVEGDGSEVGPMPPYDWCDAAYVKMWHRFQNELRNPFSEYPYLLRQEVLHKMSYQRIFEECWNWVYTATYDTSAEDFDPFQVREGIYDRILSMVQVEYEPRNHSTTEVLEGAFGEHTLLAEHPVVSVFNLEDDLTDPGYGVELCQDFYLSQELEPLEDVEMEVHGPFIDLAQFTSAKPPAVDDFCTWCQEKIGLDDPAGMHCLVPNNCTDTFHAGCLAAWVNGASLSAHQCPNCKVTMTNQRRFRRMVD